MNILFYLTPKCDCAYLEENDSLRQALEKLEARRYTTIPLLSNSGIYIGTISEGDLLWSIKNRFNLDLRKAEHVRITDIERHRDYNGSFIGIVTRQEIIKYFYNLTKKEDAVS